MSSTEILDFDALLKPISEEHPCGEDLREDISPTSDYYALKDARANARAEERQHMYSDDEESQSTADKSWKAIIQQAPKLLSNKTKDLEVVAWLIEGLVRIHQLDGLSEGLKLARNYIDTFWDDLYPLPDEDGYEVRIAALGGLSGASSPGTIIPPINLIALTVDSGDDGEYSQWDYLQAIELEKSSNQKDREHKIQSGVVTLAQFDSKMEVTNLEYLLDISEHITHCLEHVAVISDSLDGLCSGDSPSFSNLRNTLDDCLNTVNKYIQKKQSDEQESVESSGLADEVASNVDSANLETTNSTAKDRKVALAMLAQAAEYFKKAEPHSPISYAVERLIRWADMELPQLLNELIVDPNAKDDYCRLTGVALLTPEQPSNPHMGQMQNYDQFGGVGGMPPPPPPDFGPPNFDPGMGGMGPPPMGPPPMMDGPMGPPPMGPPPMGPPFP